MKKHLLLSFVLLITVYNTEAQSDFYFANHQRQYWQEDSSSINIIVGNMQNYDLIVRNLSRIFSSVNDTVRYSNEDDNIIVVSNDLKNMDLQQLLLSVCLNPSDILFVSYAKKINNRYRGVQSHWTMRHSEYLLSEHEHISH
ncbi:MAG: hypothetical protein IKU03_03855 [Bacteroidales bacterium]|nr:hypothetical protein [Bacteroidales bacterium]